MSPAQAVTSWYNHDALPTVDTQHASSAVSAADAVAMDTGDETPAKLSCRRHERHRLRRYGVTSQRAAVTDRVGDH